MTYNEAIEQIKLVIPRNQIMISQKDVNKLTSISITSLNKDVKENTGIPYKVVRSKIYYAVIDVARWMSDTPQVIAQAN